ncbi:NAD(P)-dependent dehydrogenase (short-subunit alcohol dehydrogenase family) [Catenuloplanes nepalensis]|uniref:NAD(P)-dependent dehydrogenase (Short-subunit alcohol dehydrogenase family) n=1 Tax=Catenuloplanes nepalensis TaxID=587533 RepID=A0ABT9MVS6_9ACTN|nr:SDR family NAD(P)-dependent oxidoreductase [Catenuloplanes nepalensis]MDP9795480.1 NAD(P)-dependent dehydrogenase (short-subunit alcohol dehydrogenase family) [Catenuloplanes nepalensis]
MRTTAEDVVRGLDLRGRRIIVTGGGSGLGAETARVLASAGAEVTIGVRTPVPGARAIPLDLADLESVRAFAKAWDGPLDALIANAGVMAIPTRQRSAAGWEMHLAVNHLGHFALARALRPALRASGAGRLVVLSSGAHRDHPLDREDPHFARRPYDRWAAYGQSKTADVLLAVAAARRWAGDGILANAANPGWVMTGLQRHVDDETMRAMGAMDADGNVVPQPYSRTLAEGAAGPVTLAVSATTTGAYYEDAAPSENVAPHAVDPETAAWLWDHASEALRAS